MKEINQEQIDNYHSGRMNESEMADFNAKLDADPTLKSENAFQSDVIEGLKEFRKAELKTRLEAINVGPSWFEFVQQSALMKSMGGVVVASIIGSGIYFLGENANSETVQSPVVSEIDAPQKESIDFVWELGLEEVTKQNNSLEKGTELEVNATTVSEPKKSKIEDTRDQDLVEEVRKEEVFKPSFDAPTAQSLDEENSFAASGLDELPENNASKVTDEPIDVKTESRRNASIKYKYYDGKLFLSGDFDKNTYEILEINNASGKRIYVLYLDKYYKVGVTDRLTQLPEVTDKETIKELELLRANK